MQRSSGRTFPFLLAAIAAATLLLACKTLPGPREITADGLERMPSRASGGVFRKPGAPFTQYKRIIVEPLTVEFRKGWEDQHDEVDARELKRIRDEAMREFREEIVETMIDEGPYTFADEPAADVLMVTPAVTALDIPAPSVDVTRTTSYAPRSVAMRITGELRDAATGTLVGRVDMFGGGEEYGVGINALRPANRVTNAHEMRQSYERWVRLLREAIDVAKVEKPRQ